MMRQILARLRLPPEIWSGLILHIEVRNKIAETVHQNSGFRYGDMLVQLTDGNLYHHL
ncbi:hypothetical protein EDF88_4582 [Buttiauxella sp. BIGb0552]|nr:hypothetical protein EDF88_4582 [Buttiauxella sp. BIGb0552]